MLHYADDDTHGYSQKPPSGRWGPDYDCSSLIYQAANDAGIAMGQQQAIFNQQQCCCDIKQTITAEGNATRAMIQQNKIEALQQQVNDLNLQAQMAGVVRYPMSTAYNAGFNPFCNCGNGCM